MIDISTDTPIYAQMLRELAGFPYEWLADVGQGATFSWQHDIQVIVTRVAADRSWVDLQWTVGGVTFTKQVRLCELLATAQESEPDEADESTRDDPAQQDGDDQ